MKFTGTSRYGNALVGFRCAITLIIYPNVRTRRICHTYYEVEWNYRVLITYIHGDIKPAGILRDVVVLIKNVRIKKDFLEKKRISHSRQYALIHSEFQIHDIECAEEKRSGHSVNTDSVITPRKNTRGRRQ